MVPSSVGLRRTLMTALAASFSLVVPLGGIAVAQEGDHAVGLTSGRFPSPSLAGNLCDVLQGR